MQGYVISSVLKSSFFPHDPSFCCYPPIPAVLMITPGQRKMGVLTETGRLCILKIKEIFGKLYIDLEVIHDHVFNGFTTAVVCGHPERQM